MKKYLSLILFSMIIIIISSCKENDLINSSDNITTESTEVTSFDKISISNGFQLILIEGNESKVEIEASDNLHKHIDVKVDKKELKVKIKDKIKFDNSSNVKVYVTYDSLVSIKITGGSKVNFESTYMLDSLYLELSGGSILTADLNCKNFETKVTGGGKLILTGFTEFCNIDLSGGSTSESYDFAIDDLVCEISGGGVVSHTVNKTIEIDASGGSTFNYKGDAVITKQDLSGGSSVVKK